MIGGKNSIRQRIHWYDRSHIGVRGLNNTLNRKILNVLQRRFTYFSSNCGINILRPSMNYARTTHKRSRQGFYREKCSAGTLDSWDQRAASTLQKNHAGEHVLKERWLNEMQKINANVRTLKERGARVVFIQLPISGNVLNAYDQLYPKAVYWDSIPDLVDVDLIHFDEHTALSGLSP